MAYLIDRLHVLLISPSRPGGYGFYDNSSTWAIDDVDENGRPRLGEEEARGCSEGQNSAILGADEELVQAKGKWYSFIQL